MLPGSIIGVFCRDDKIHAAFASEAERSVLGWVNEWHARGATIRLGEARGDRLRTRTD